MLKSMPKSVFFIFNHTYNISIENWWNHTKPKIHFHVGAIPWEKQTWKLVHIPRDAKQDLKCHWFSRCL